MHGLKKKKQEEKAIARKMSVLNKQLTLITSASTFALFCLCMILLSSWSTVSDWSMENR
jgi:tetrahydromethanopterin S-methyltransferase subunit C